MRIFLLIYFTVYGGANLYLLFALWRAGCGAPWWRGLAVALAVAMCVLAPFLTHTLDRLGWPTLATVTAFAGFTWMVLVMWAVLLFLGFDLWNLALRILAFWHPSCRHLLVAAPRVVAVTAAVLAVLGLAGLAGDLPLRTRTIHIADPRLAAMGGPVRVVLISDLHLGLTAGARRLRQIVRTIDELQPDLILCAGDMLDASDGLRLDALAPALASLQPRLGKIAVTGNHEFYSGVEASIEFMEAAGFTVLREGAREIAPGLCIAGVDDPAGARRSVQSRTDEALALANCDPQAFVILLKHQPLVDAVAATRVDLQLSGHTHGGQVFPFNFMVARVYPHTQGMHRVTERLRLYVSPGTGSWGPPMRLFTTREVTLFILAAP